MIAMTEPLCLDQLDDGALDALPFGVVRIGPSGVVERYNRTEAARAGVQRWRALGRPFLRDLAGKNAAALAAEIAAVPPGAQRRVFHTFEGYSRRTSAVIDIARCDAERVYLCIRSAE